MSLSRRVLLALPLPVLAGLPLSAAAEAGSPPGVVEAFYATLLQVMKEAKRLSFDQRYNLLAPATERAFDLPLMTRLAIGQGWPQLTPTQQQRLTAALSRYTIATYANRFDDYGGERFEVTPTATPTPQPNPTGDVIVASRLVKADGQAVQLNYRMRRQPDNSWKIIDVYLSGNISELAARRSEFVSVLQRDGAEGLVELIEKRTAALRTG